MSTRANLIRRGTGLVKVDVLHNGSETIRTNLRSSLFGTTGEKSTHVVEVRELTCDMTEPMLTVPKTKQFFFRVVGKNKNVDLRDENFRVSEFYLGESVVPGGVSANNGGIIGVPEDEFTFYVPSLVFCLQDFVWAFQKKCKRINEVLHSTGWNLVLGIAANHAGMIDGGVGTAGYNNIPPIIPSDPIPTHLLPEPLLQLAFTGSGLLGFHGSATFWNSFAIQLSPYAQQLFGLPELLCRAGDVSGEDASTVLAQWNPQLNAVGYTIFSTKSLYNTLEERESVLVTSDIPIPRERVLVNGEDTSRFVFGHFDIAGHRKLYAGRTVENIRLSDTWFLEGPSAVARQLMDPPGSNGFCSLVLPSIIPSFNIRIHCRRKQWNFETNTYSEVETPLLKSSIDCAVLRLLFTLQQ